MYTYAPYSCDLYHTMQNIYSNQTIYSSGKLLLVLGSMTYN